MVVNMARTCPVCERLNPEGARFCYFDGATLTDGQATAVSGAADVTPSEEPPGTQVKSTPNRRPTTVVAAGSPRPRQPRYLRATAAAVLTAILAASIGSYLFRNSTSPNSTGPAPALSASPPLSPPLSPPKRVAAVRPSHTAPTELAGATTGRSDDPVNDAIRRGVAYLKSSLRLDDPPRADGHEFPAGTPPTIGDAKADMDYGQRALIALTLLECGVPSDDLLIQETIKLVRGPVHPHSTWSLAWSIQLLDRVGDKADEPIILSRTMRLVAGQTAHGNWSRVCPPLRPDEQAALLAYLDLAKHGKSLSPQEQALQAKREALREKLRHYNETSAASLHHVSYDRPVRDGNLASTRFAILGLNVARRHNLPVEPLLPGLDTYLRRYQHSDGSWWSAERAPSFNRHRADMTCVGLLGLAATHGMLSRPGPIISDTNDPAVSKGLRFLNEALEPLQVSPAKYSLSPYVNTIVGAEAEDSLQFLWSLSEVAALYDVDKIARRDWHARTCELILACQHPDGSWWDHNRIPIDTSYALLALKRMSARLGIAARQTLKQPPATPLSPNSRTGTPTTPVTPSIVPSARFGNGRINIHFREAAPPTVQPGPPP